MGYYADTSWDVTFRSEEALKECRKEIVTEFGEPWGQEDEGILDWIGEFATENWEGLNLIGWTSGKYFHDANEVYPIVAKYADGEVEVNASDSGDGHWKYVLKDGAIKVHKGRIVYDDALEPFKESAKALQAAVDADDWTATDDLFAAMQENALEIVRGLSGMN